jgi:hypothetical protein
VGGAAMRGTAGSLFLLSESIFPLAADEISPTLGQVTMIWDIYISMEDDE